MPYMKACPVAFVNTAMMLYVFTFDALSALNQGDADLNSSPLRKGNIVINGVTNGAEGARSSGNIRFLLAFPVCSHYLGVMIMLGTSVNAAAIVVGSFLGLKGGHLLSSKVRDTMMAGLGLAVLLIGCQLALKSKEPMIVIGSLIGGGITGELLRIEARLEELGALLGRRFQGSGKVAEGFVTASLLYCVGAMAIMGALQDGLGSRPDILYAKAALDGIASVALASTLGIGVLFSALPLLAYQGTITLCATFAQHLLTPTVVQEMNAVGGLLIVAISLDLLGIKRLPVGNLLPAVFLAPPLVIAFAA